MPYFIFDEQKKPVAVSFEEWLKWRKKQPEDYYRVASTDVKGKTVSTVFLHGIDHSYDGGKPVLWETMIFPEGDYCERYTSYEDALKGHQQAVESLEK